MVMYLYSAFSRQGSMRFTIKVHGWDRTSSYVEPLSVHIWSRPTTQPMNTSVAGHCCAFLFECVFCFYVLPKLAGVARDPIHPNHFHPKYSTAYQYCAWWFRVNTEMANDHFYWYLSKLLSQKGSVRIRGISSGDLSGNSTERNPGES